MRRAAPLLTAYALFLGLLAGATDWPTLHGDPQRSGFIADFPTGKLTLQWRKELWQEMTAPRAEVIVANGLAYLGTYAGTLHAWDAATGEERWKIQTSAPIGHSAAYADGSVFFGSMDKKFRAVDATTGQLRWEFSANEGIWTAPLVASGKVFFGARDGSFYALQITDGHLAWKCPTDGPILQTASLSEDGTRIIFTSEDMHVYCLAADDGRVLWKSPQLAGLSARDYAPLIAGGLAFITTNPAKDFHATLGEHEKMLVARTGFTGQDQRYIPGTADDVRAEQDFIVDFLRQHPNERTFYAFRVDDGTEPWLAPILYTGGLHNPPSPPCANRQSGEVFVQLRSAYSPWDGGGEVRSYTCFGPLDLKAGRVALINHSYPSKEPGRPPGAKDTPWMAFNYIGDETQTLSCAPGCLFSNHQGFLGALDLTTGKVESLFGKRDTYGGYYGPGQWGWENQDGPDKARAAGQPYGILNEWHGPARSIATVAGGRVFYHTGSQLLCFAPQR
jgi:outer membrane protein assembly factor BamB